MTVGKLQELTEDVTKFHNERITSYNIVFHDFKESKISDIEFVEYAITYGLGREALTYIGERFHIDIPIELIE